jgi:uncharacterized tellurite resistance protein B-like protein
MNYENYRIVFEKGIRQDLEQLFRADLVHFILKTMDVDQDKDDVKNILENQSYRISEILAPKLFHIIKDVENKLKIDFTVDYYISSEPGFNAFSIWNTKENAPHKIVFSSGIVEKFDDIELMFVIGHELSHLIYQDSLLDRVIHFIYSEKETETTILNKVKLWKKLAELNADRIGLLAAGNLSKCISAFIKLSSGIGADFLLTNSDEYIEVVQKLFEDNEQSADLLFSHPANPIRVKALVDFEKSKTYQSHSLNHSQTLEDTDLRIIDEKIFTLLIYKGNSELENARHQFLLSGGLILAMADDAPSMKEIEVIIDIVSDYTFAAEKEIDKMLQYPGDKIMKIFKDAVKFIIQKNHPERYAMFSYLVAIALCDSQIDDKEIDLLFHIGKVDLGLSMQELVQILGDQIKARFKPSVL